MGSGSGSFRSGFFAAFAALFVFALGSAARATFFSGPSASLALVAGFPPTSAHSRSAASGLVVARISSGADASSYTSELTKTFRAETPPPICTPRTDSNASVGSTSPFFCPSRSNARRSNRRQNHPRRAGSCDTFTAAPPASVPVVDDGDASAEGLALEPALSEASFLPRSFLYRLLAVMRTARRPTRYPAADSERDGCAGSAHRTSTCTAKTRSGSSLTCAYANPPARPSAGRPTLGTRA